MKKCFAGYLVLFSLLFLLALPKNCLSMTLEQEPNNSMRTAQKIVMGEEYIGAVVDGETDDEDYYSIPVTEGKYYLISVYDIADVDRSWKTLIVSLSKETNTNSNYSIVGGFDYSNTDKLFRASYTGNYYLKFWNTSNTKYRFRIVEHSVIGKSVKDSDSNSYRITDDDKIELTKIASKKKTSFYLDSEKYFSNIGNYDVVDYYDAPFSIISIGRYAFKGSNITHISIPSNIKRIGVGAFQNCKKLGTEKYIMGVVFDGKNVIIEKKAFSGCKNLRSIRILKGASIKSVKKNAFKGTKKGIRIEVPKIKKYKRLFKNVGFKQPEYSLTYL